MYLTITMKPGWRTKENWNRKDLQLQKFSYREALHRITKTFFRFSKLNDRRLSAKKVLYTEKDRSTSHVVTGVNLKFATSTGDNFCSISDTKVASFPAKIFEMVERVL